MAKTYRPYVPEQDLLLAPSLRNWLPENDLAYFVTDLMDQLDLSAITTVHEDEERGYPDELEFGPMLPMLQTPALSDVAVWVVTGVLPGVGATGDGELLLLPPAETNIAKATRTANFKRRHERHGTSSTRPRAKDPAEDPARVYVDGFRVDLGTILRGRRAFTSPWPCGRIRPRSWPARRAARSRRARAYR
jgi:hypothetical protein